MRIQAVETQITYELTVTGEELATIEMGLDRLAQPLMPHSQRIAPQRIENEAHGLRQTIRNYRRSVRHENEA